MKKISFKKLAASLNKTQVGLYTLLFLAVRTLFPSAVYADALSDRLQEVAEARDETTLINAVLRFAIPLGIMALVGLSGYAGFLMITSQGNPEKLGEAKEVITNAVLGFALVALSVSILLLLRNVLDIPGINP